MQPGSSSIRRVSRAFSSFRRSNAGAVVAAALALAAARQLPAQTLAMNQSGIPAINADSRVAGARLMRSGVASQFDSIGITPMAKIGDPVTVYLFSDGEHMSRVQHATVTSRKRFEAPASWRAACDEVAHAGWFYNLTPASRAPFAVIIPGSFAWPLVRPLPPAARDGAWQFYRALADSSFQHYRAFLHPASDRAEDYAHKDFWGPVDDARWNQVKMFGVHGPGGREYAALSFTFRDDYPSLPNTARTWILDSWGYPVASLVGDIDIYGTVDDASGVDAIVTSSGLIRWNGSRWQLPAKYSEEPCLYHQTMPLPAGAHP